MQTKFDRFKLTLIVLLLSSTLVGLANTNLQIKPMTHQGKLQSIVISSDKTRITISPTGKLLNSAVVHNITLNRSDKLKISNLNQKNSISYRADHTPFKSNPTKVINKINGIAISYYPCQAMSNFRVQRNYPSGGIPRSNQPSPEAKAITKAILAGYPQSRCKNPNGGKVRQIGPYSFTYYQTRNTYQTNSFSPLSGSYGKIKRAGPYHFTYYPNNSTGNQPGNIMTTTKSN